MRVSLIVPLLAACAPAGPPVEIVAPPALAGLAGSFAAYLPWEGVPVVEAADPVARLALPGAGRLAVALVADEQGCECYRIERGPAARTFIVHGDAPLGVQYGLAAVLEAGGVTFAHPYRTIHRATLEVDEAALALGERVVPEQRLRGLHLHTLHPIEGYFALWEPSEAHQEAAFRLFDWVVKNRGNYVQWVTLDDIQRVPARAQAWEAYTRTLVAEAHRRGLGVGMGVQLFGSGNLQRAWDLVDEPLAAVPGPQQIAARLPQIAGMGLDKLNLSFGEFFGEPPDVFLREVNHVAAALRAIAPATELTTVIHVGNKPDQRVTYMGEDLQYYFLVKFADPSIVPWVHTVMYYNLFDDAGGAYEHDQFDEHRRFLLERLRAGQRVGYFPESAYWIAFDNSVPTYLPLYVRSRLRDMTEVRAQAPPGLAEHVLFSSGWEWGYWQIDAATLRMGHRLPASTEESFRALFAPYGAAGRTLAAEVARLAELQHQHLIVGRLAAYYAGRDFYIDTGDEIDIHSQPDRPSFAELVARPPAEREAFLGDVVARLERLAGESAGVAAAVDGLDLPADPFVAELRDGLAIDVERARYIAALYAAVLDQAAGRDPSPRRQTARAALDAGHEIVARRRQGFHYPVLEELTAPLANETIYTFGYLKQADELCLWEREWIDARNVLEGRDEALPTCIF
jgi:hypothetical protein